VLSIALKWAQCHLANLHYSRYSQWPTFPQVYINGEFFGGADIVMEAAQNGQLKEALEVAAME